MCAEIGVRSLPDAYVRSLPAVCVLDCWLMCAILTTHECVYISSLISEFVYIRLLLESPYDYNNKKQ